MSRPRASRIVGSLLAAAAVVAAFIFFVFPDVPPYLLSRYRDARRERAYKAWLRLDSAIIALTRKPVLSIDDELALVGYFEQCGGENGLGSRARILERLSQIESPQARTLKALTDSLVAVPDSEKNSGGWNKNYPVIATLGMMGPGALPALEALRRFPTEDEAIERIAGAPKDRESAIARNFQRYANPERSVVAGWSGRLSSVRSPETLLIEDPDSLRALWKKIAPADREPRVDFSRHAVLAYFPGRSNSLEGFGFESYKNLVATFESGSTDQESWFFDAPFVIVVIARPRTTITVKEHHHQGRSVQPESEKIVARIEPALFRD